MIDPGTAVAAANAVANLAKAFGGGGSGPAVVTGYRIGGTATPSGFTGLVAGLGRHGNGAPYIDEAGAWGEEAALNRYVREQWAGFFGEDARPVSLSFDTPYNFELVRTQVRETFAKEAEARKVGAFTGTTTGPAMPAAGTTLTGAGAATVPQPAAQASSGGSVAADPGPPAAVDPFVTAPRFGSVPVPDAPGAALPTSSGPDVLGLLAIAGAAYLAWKGA